MLFKTKQNKTRLAAYALFLGYRPFVQGKLHILFNSDDMHQGWCSSLFKQQGALVCKLAAWFGDPWHLELVYRTAQLTSCVLRVSKKEKLRLLRC